MPHSAAWRFALKCNATQIYIMEVDMGGFNLPRKIRRVGIKHLWQIAGIQKEKQEIKKKMFENYLKNRKG